MEVLIVQKKICNLCSENHNGSKSKQDVTEEQSFSFN